MTKFKLGSIIGKDLDFAVDLVTLVSTRMLLEGNSITGDSLLYWRKDGVLQFSSIKELYDDFTSSDPEATYEALTSFGETIKDSKIGWSRISDVIDHGIKPVYKIEVSGGKSIKVTKDHSLFYSEGYQILPASMASRPWRRGQERKMIQVGTRIICSSIQTNNQTQTDWLPISGKMLLLAGLWIADGSFDKCQVSIATGDNGAINSFLLTIPRMYGSTTKQYMASQFQATLLEESPEYYHAHFGKARVEFGNKALVDYLRMIGFRGDSHTKRVPDWMFTANEAEIGLFLKGYFSGDGSVHRQGNNRIIVECASCSKELLKDIQILLERLGIQGTIDKGYVPSKNNFNSVNIQYKLRIERKRCIERFLSKVGFLYEVDPSLLEILANESSKNLNDLMTRTINSIAPAGEEHVYDLSIPKTERFIANGILCHNSGSGKSYAIRRLCEVTHGKVQQILIDMEGEFSSLREKFDYLVIGKNADRTADVNTADVLARRLLELKVSTIIDLSDLKLHERIRYVRLFLESLMDAPRELWHPALIVIDEAHVFDPESGSAESSEAVISLATQGRKRGFAAVLATQRISQLDKAALAQMNNVLIGHTWLNNDKQRCSEVLGFTSKEQTNTLRDLKPGQFYAFGPAFSPGVELVQIDKVETKHPEPGEQMPKVPPVTDQMKRELAKLDDIPEVKKRELKERQDFVQEIRSLRGQLAQARRPDLVDNTKLNQIKDQFFEKGQRAGEQSSKIEIQKLTNTLKQYQRILQDISVKSAQAAKIEIPKFEPMAQRSPPQRETMTRSIAPIQSTLDLRQVSESLRESEGLRAGAMKMLKAVAQFHELGRHCSREQIGTFAGFSPKGGTFSTYISELKNLGWIVERSSQDISITDEGLRNAGNIDPLPTDRDSLLSMWKSKFRDGAAQMLQVLADCYPESISREELGEKSGFAHNGGTFSTYLSELKRNALVIEEKGTGVRASPALFLEDE